MGMERFTVAPGTNADYGASLTFSVILTCVMAASGGLIYGYDIGISGGVSSMESFLSKFFPDVQRKRMKKGMSNVFCVYDNQALTAFTSSLYLAGLVASLFAGKVTNAIGRRAIMLLGGALFFSGAALNAAAVNIAMLIIGRILLGFGIGFTTQATPVYLAEMAPPRWRGAFVGSFPLFITVGILIANLTNYGTNNIKGWGWRLSLGLAAAPASIIVLGALFITDSPSSLVVRGKHDAAKRALRLARGPDADVDAELKDVIRSVEKSKMNDEEAYRRIIRREYRPQLVMAVGVILFFELTGIVVPTFFSPLLFRTIGFGSDAALMGAVILGVVNIASLLLSTLIIDRVGRRPLLFMGGVAMVFYQVAIAWIMGRQTGLRGNGVMSHGYAVAVLVLMCCHSATVSVTLSTVKWVIPGEIFPVEIRSAGNGISSAVNLGLVFIQTQSFLPMLCAFKFATFAYYAGWVAIMTTFFAFFMPETKGIPLESMTTVWARHWYWGRFVREQNQARDESA